MSGICFVVLCGVCSKKYMESGKIFCAILFLVLAFTRRFTATAAQEHGRDYHRRCNFPAIYNFGDSNSDTGAISAAIKEVPPPNGETFFRKPSGRFCDGRLIIDFIAEDLELPYLSPYLESVGTNFRHGANFATGGSSIRPGGFSPFHLGIQISQFIHFKARTTALYSQLKSNQKSSPKEINTFPQPQDFPRALYIFDIGQNDLAYGFQHMAVEQVRASIPDILNQFSDAIQVLYKEGARFFWVHNTGPIGCLPYTVIYDRSKNLDRYGCVKDQNEIAMEFNRQLKSKISEFKTKFSNAVFIYADVYSAKYDLIGQTKNLGFADRFSFCCGSYYGYHIDCGKTAVINGTEYGKPCHTPSSHISWDGIHYTEAVNRRISGRILNGSLSDPPISIQDACCYPR